VTEAKGGNVKAIELYYRKMEGWEPKNAVEVSRGRDGVSGMSNEELIKSMILEMGAEDRRKFLDSVAGDAT
jgi:hypothetical protein